MKTYEVKFDADGQDFWEFEADSPKEAYESFLNVYNGDPYAYDFPIVVWEGLEKVATYKNHIGELDRIKEVEKERRSLEIKKQKEAEKAFFNNLLQKIKSEGFQKLNSQEVEAVGEVLDEVLTAKTESEEKLDLAKVTLMDEQAYKFYTLRSNTRSSLQQAAMLKAMNVNLSDISSKTSGVKMASMFTGMAAARHLGEEIAEDFGGED